MHFMQRTQTSIASDMLRRLCHWKQVLNSAMRISLPMTTWWPTSNEVTGLLPYSAYFVMFPLYPSNVTQSKL